MGYVQTGGGDVLRQFNEAGVSHRTTASPPLPLEVSPF